MRVLVLSAAVPFPPHGGGRMRTYQLTKALASEHDVTVVAFGFQNDPVAEPDIEVRLVTVPWEPSADLLALNEAGPSEAVEAAERLLAFDAPPWFASYYESERMRAALRELQGTYDLVLIEGSDMGLFLPELQGTIVLDLMDVYTSMAQRDAVSAPPEEAASLVTEAERTRRFESEVARRAHLCLVVSRREAQSARQLLGAERVEIVPNGVDTNYFRACDPRESSSGYLLFTGTMNYRPNVEAAVVFAEDILPRVRERVPAAHLHIVGASPTPEVVDLQGDAVTVHGSVSDMRPYLAKAEVVGVPLQRGGGTRLKILEAAASGRSVVSTSIGAEGLDLDDGEHLVIADQVEAFADAIVHLLQDPDRRSQLGSAARAAVTIYDWGAIGSSLLSAVEKVS